VRREEFQSLTLVQLPWTDTTNPTISREWSVACFDRPGLLAPAHVFGVVLSWGRLSSPNLLVRKSAAFVSYVSLLAGIEHPTRTRTRYLRPPFPASIPLLDVLLRRESLNSLATSYSVQLSNRTSLNEHSNPSLTSYLRPGYSTGCERLNNLDWPGLHGTDPFKRNGCLSTDLSFWQSYFRDRI
jgi:hypothetical protein